MEYRRSRVVSSPAKILGYMMMLCGSGYPFRPDAALLADDELVKLAYGLPKLSVIPRMFHMQEERHEAPRVGL